MGVPTLESRQTSWESKFYKDPTVEKEVMNLNFGPKLEHTKCNIIIFENFHSSS